MVQATLFSTLKQSTNGPLSSNSFVQENCTQCDLVNEQDDNGERIVWRRQSYISQMLILDTRINLALFLSLVPGQQRFIMYHAFDFFLK